jgi:hypothetical protein
MPTISEFFGIKIALRFLDHNPPHFHATYQKDKVMIEIENGKVRGEMSERALRLVLEWLSLHRDELREAWEKASNGQEPNQIEPLK